MYLKESCFPDCWSSLSVVPVFTSVGERSILLVLRLCLVISLESVDYLKKCGPFSDSQHGFRPAQLTADPLIVVSDRTASAFNKAGTT